MRANHSIVWSRLFHDLVVVEHVARRGGAIWSPGSRAPVDGVERRLCQIYPRAEGTSAPGASPTHSEGDAVVIAPMWTHQVVVLVLQRGFLADFDAVALEGVGRYFDHRTVMFGSGAGPRLVRGMQHAIAALGHQRPAIEIGAADTFRRPVGVALVQRVVVGRAQESARFGLLPAGPRLLGAGLVRCASLGSRSM